MRAIALNATLKRSPGASSTEALTQVVLDALASYGVEGTQIRLADHVIEPGVVSEAITPEDEWPAIRQQILDADILIIATPTWLGQPSSISKLVLERMDAMLSESNQDGVPVAFNKVAGVVVVGNEDGAHHCIAEIGGALTDIGFTIPGQAWTYWNKGPGPGDEVYLTTNEKDWTDATGRAAASNLFHTAVALRAHPIPAPPS